MTMIPIIATITIITSVVGMRERRLKSLITSFIQGMSGKKFPSSVVSLK